MAFWIAVASTRIVHAVTLRDDSVEFHVLLGSWRVSKDKLRGVLPYITPPYWFLWAPHLGFSVAAPPWRLPLFVLRADNPWAPDHDAYQTQYRRLLAYLEASCPKARLGGWERNLGLRLPGSAAQSARTSLSLTPDPGSSSRRSWPGALRSRSQWWLGWLGFTPRSQQPWRLTRGSCSLGGSSPLALSWRCGSGPFSAPR